MSADRGPFIITASGRPFYLADPKPEEVFLPDILTAMDNLCRYTGHYKWSDAKHLLLCYFIDQSPEVVAHDFGEAYYGDMSSPWKRVLGDGIRPALAKIDLAVAAALGLQPGYLHLPKVKRVDAQAFWVERHVLGLPDRVQFEDLIGFVAPEGDDELARELTNKTVEYAEFLLKYPAAKSRLQGICEYHFPDERLW